MFFKVARSLLYFARLHNDLLFIVFTVISHLN